MLVDIFQLCGYDGKVICYGCKVICYDGKVFCERGYLLVLSNHLLSELVGDLSELVYFKRRLGVIGINLRRLMGHQLQLRFKLK